MKRFLFSLLALHAVTAHAQTSPAPDKHIAQLLGRMTLEEKAGQLAQWPGGLTPTGPHAAESSLDDIRRGRVGSYLALWGAETTKRLQQIAVEESRLHIPLLFAADVIHGFRTIFPVPLAEAASWDVTLAQHCAHAAALEASAWGLHWTFAPMVDIARDPRWGRVVEGSGEDPLLGSAFATARVRGFSESDPKDASALLTTAKHFVAYGAAEGGRDYNTADVSERTLREIYLPPFQAAIEAGASTLMTSFNELDGIPMHANKALVRDLLRGQWGFAGIVVSDYTGIKELMAHGVAANPADAGLLGLQAGIDIDMVSGIYVSDIPKLVSDKRLSIALVDQAVRRVLEAKQHLGLFDAPYRYSDPEREKARTLTPEARSLARQAGDEAIVLLENKKHALPLAKDLGTLAVIGALANDAKSALGSWAALGQPEDAVSVLKGIQNAISSKTKLLYARGAAPDSPDTSGIDRALQVAKTADAVVLVVGEIAEMSGEARVRSGLTLPGAQQALFDKLVALGKPVVVVLMNGRPLAVSGVAARAAALLETWFLGIEMGDAVADVLFGTVNPSGKLPISFPRNVGQIPIYYDHKPTGRPASPERYSSKYLDVPWTPLYPFGYGLSYTQFSYDAPQLSSASVAPDASLTVRVTVHNRGTRAGDEVVQLYLRDDVATVTPAVQRLRAWQRVHLEAGEARELSFVLDSEDFALLDGSLRRQVEAGSFTVMVGGSSSDVQRAHFEVTRSMHLPARAPAIPRFMRVTR
jgi:beta-glucosidase